jgi:hypothetical protein
MRVIGRATLVSPLDKSALSRIVVSPPSRRDHRRESSVEEHDFLGARSAHEVTTGASIPTNDSRNDPVSVTGVDWALCDAENGVVLLQAVAATVLLANSSVLSD